jgi:hypothetical protein
MENNIYEVIIIIGRPASGKSEIIDYLQNLPADERLRRYHVGEMDVIDDFPMLWTWFEEDAILSKVLDRPRLHTDNQGYFKYQYLWNLLIERIGLEYHKRLRDDPRYHDHTTTIVEFSRGSEHGGYVEAFSHLPEDLLKRTGILFVNVSFEESQRKNRRRFNPYRPDSILEHGLPDERLERLYRKDDWEHFSADDPAYIHVHGTKVPYVVFENEDDVTTDTPDLLAQRLEEALTCLGDLVNIDR